MSAGDGTLWSDWTTFNVNAPVDHAPVVTATDYSANHNQSIAAASLFSVLDADSDAITAYQIEDLTADATSGSWIVDGLTQPAGQPIDVTPAQLLNAKFQSGMGSDQLQVRASDGELWSDWTTFNVSVPANHAPVVMGGDATVKFNTATSVSSFFNATDADGDAIMSYQVREDTDLVALSM